MKKIKEFFAIIKKLLANKRYRSSIIFVTYIIFFIFIIIVIKTGYNEASNIDKPLENYRDLTNYSYIYKIDIDQPGSTRSEFITGKRYDNTELITYNNVSTIFKDNFLIGFPISGVDTTKFRVEYIYEYLISGVIQSDHDGIKTYSVPLTNYMKIANNLDIVSDQVVTIKTTSSGEWITDIYLDLTNYVNYSEKLYNKYEVNIKYGDINQVLEFAK